MTQFREGEEFKATKRAAPARRDTDSTPARGRNAAASSSSTKETRSTKRRMPSPELVETPARRPVKRGRVASSSTTVSAPPARTRQSRAAQNPVAQPTESISARPTRSRKLAPSPEPEVPQSPDPADEDDPMLPAEPAPEPEPKQKQKEKAMDHKTRAANPRVKMVDDFATADSGIAAKRVKPINNVEKKADAASFAGPSSNKRTPARKAAAVKTPAVPSSILRGEKGTLKTTKRTKLPEEEVPEPVNGVEGLSRLAGIDPAAADGLEDFEDQEAVAPTATPADMLQQNIAAAKNNLFPSASSVMSQAHALSNWGRSTIFGPLGFGSYVAPSSTSDSGQLVILQLGVAVFLPIALEDSTFSNVPSQNNAHSPGKFYDERHAHKLLDAVRTGGPSARVAIQAGASAEHKAHFERFRERLTEGEMFNFMVGDKSLVFCASETLVHRLNLPATLHASPGNVYTTQVDIENGEAYANVVMSAPTKDW
ncbi:Chromo domain-containing protein [Mycena chlorophos]|uniref:Chromo domain-containing protein n=1 Tax=Mycena chlorophos TaxID=658473 RepID=A0A8H6WQ81_MYCCL|nr:Chromo domain-containing protein [Mycena chlorophos]